MEKIEKLFTLAEVKEINEEERSLVGYASTSVLDRDRELIKTEGWELDNFKKNPVILLSHEYRQPPIGKALWIKKDENGLKFKAQFAKTQVAEEVFQLYKDGFMRAFSVGFIPKEWEDGDLEDEKKPRRIYTRQELLEISAVSVPSNPEALVAAVNEGRIKTKTLREALHIVEKPEETENYIRVPVPGEEGKHEGHKIRTITVSEKQGIKALYCVDCKKIITYLFDKSCKNKPNKCDWTMEEAQEWVSEHQEGISEWISEHKWVQKHLKEKRGDEMEIMDAMQVKGVIPYKETPKAPEDEPWDGPKEVREADVEDLRIMCAWYDETKPDVKQSYKLPHHKASGQHAVVWRGVAAAMAALLGARGGVDIPDSDRKGVYNHLAKEYKRFDKEPPEFREYSEDELKEMFPEVYPEKQTYECECIECGYVLASDEHCRNIKCPECGGEMRRLERPGPGQQSIEDTLRELKEEIKDLKEGRVLSEKNRKLIQDAITQMKEAISALEKLLEATEPPERESVLDIEEKKEGTKKVVEIDENKLKEVIANNLKALVTKITSQQIDRMRGRVL